MTFNRNLLLISSISLALSGCNSGENNTVEELKTVSLKGVAINGGYINGATAFVDYNFNGKLDKDEPSAISNADGIFNIDGINPDWVHLSTLTVNVPINAKNNQENAYQLLSPPSLITPIVGEILTVTPFTTIIGIDVDSKIQANGTKSAAELAKKLDFQNELSANMKSQMEQISARYNIPAEKLLGDYLESNDPQLQDLAQKLSNGLTHSMPAANELAIKYPTADRATVEYYLEADSQGEYSQWMRQDKVHWYLTNEWVFTTSTADENFNVVQLLSEDALRVKGNTNIVIKDGYLVNYNKDFNAYLCDQRLSATEPRQQQGGIAYSFDIKATYQGDTAESCLTFTTPISSKSYRLGKENYLNELTMTEGGWFYFYENDDAFISDFADSIINNTLTDPDKFHVFDALTIGSDAMDINDAHASKNYTRGLFWSESVNNIELYRHVGVDGNGWEKKEIRPDGTIGYFCDKNRDKLQNIKEMNYAQCQKTLKL